MKQIDSMSVLGVIVGLSLVILGIMVGGNIAAFWDPAGLLITFGGSFGALMVNFRASEIKTVFLVTKQAFVRRDVNIVDLNRKFVYLAQRARKEGLLVLEDELEEIEDPFLRNGLQMVIDGFEPEAIRHILEAEISSLESRHKLGQSLYRSWGTLTPAFGMIGTLIGLVMMLARLDDPDAIGPGMSVALLTTFYGVLIANLILLPLAGKLSIYSDREVRLKEIMIETLLALQSGINPRLLQEQLKAYYSPAEKKIIEAAESSRRSAEDPGEMRLNA